MIAWKDIFKPRYALLVELTHIPMPPESGDFNDFSGWTHQTTPVVRRVPIKRPLSMGFNEFYNTICDQYGLGTLVFCGSYRTFRNIYGIGSCEKHNMKNALYLAPYLAP